MKFLILSDSHGKIDPMAQAVDLSQPDLIFHLGDCWADAEELRRLYPQIPLEQVPGNCDFRSQEPAERLLFLREQRTGLLGRPNPMYPEVKCIAKREDSAAKTGPGRGVVCEVE